VTRVTAALAPSCMGHSASYRLLGRREEIVFRVGSTAMLVKRKTPNKGTTHRKPVVQRVQPLLKCVPSCRVRTLWMDGAQGLHTERSLQLYDNKTVSHSSSSISSSQSHRSCSLYRARSCPTEPSGGAGLTHLCSRTVARSPTHRSLPYNHLPAAANSAEGVSPRRSPFRRAGFTHVTRGWMI
jgi:hypothetical protein